MVYGESVSKENKKDEGGEEKKVGGDSRKPSRGNGNSSNEKKGEEEQGKALAKQETKEKVNGFKGEKRKQNAGNQETIHSSGWGKGKEKTPEENIQRHFEDHGKQFPHLKLQRNMPKLQEIL